MKFEYHGLTSWLPLFIAETQEISGLEISAAVAIFEIGTLVGALLLGFISDLIKRRYLTLFIAVAIGSIFTQCLTQKFSKIIIFFVGMLVGGSHLVVGTVMSADIGRDTIGKKNLATIVGIVYGFGSLGTCIGGVTLGYV